MSRLQDIIKKTELTGDDLDYLFTMDVPEYKAYYKLTSRLNSELKYLDAKSAELRQHSSRQISE